MTDVSEAERRGDMLLDLGRPVEAERLFREALAGEPGNADLLVGLARAQLGQQRYAEAEQAAGDALGLDPENLTGLLVISAAMAGQDNAAGGLEAVRHGLRLAPGLSVFHRQEGALLLASDRPQAALESLERARALDPEDSDAASFTAAALMELRRLDDADRAVRDALRLDPDNAEAHRIRGLLALRRGGGAAAVEAHRRALQLDPTDPDYREGLSYAMKSRNPVYGQLLRFHGWLDSLPAGWRWGFVFAPFVASRILRPFRDQLWAEIVLGLVIALLVVSWTLEPLMNAVLLLGRFSRSLLARSAKIATGAFLGLMGAGLVAVAVGWSTGRGQALALGGGLVLWSVSAGHLHLAERQWRSTAERLVIGGAALSVVCAVAIVLAPAYAALTLAALIMSGIAMMWFTALT